MVQYPSLSRSSVRHVELVPLTTSRLLLVLITSTGRVEQRVVEPAPSCPSRCSPSCAAQLNASTARASGCPRPPAVWPTSPTASRRDQRPAVSAVLSALLESLVEEHEERVVLGGTANLARFGPDFPQTIRPVLEALEEQMVLLRLLGEATDPSVLQVRIGHENPHAGLTDHLRGERRLRHRDRDARQARRPRADPDGLPRNDGSGARGGSVRRSGSSARAS